MTLERIHTDIGPVLSDGTTLRELIDTERREVSMRVLTDPELYRLELEHLFRRAWLIVGHEDEIPTRGDYVTRSVGEDNVIISRGEDGAIHALLNVCTHRGTRVCRAEAGNAERFTCPYHGWTFNNDGRFLAAPMAAERMHGDICSKAELGLVRGRVGTYVGMIFVTFDESAPTLDEYLGPIKWYTDLVFARRESGMTVLGAPQRFIIKANWKSAAEQCAGDVFHAMNLHRSIFEMLGLDSSPDHLAGYAASAPQGHFMHCFDARTAFERIAWFMGGNLAEARTAGELLRALPPTGMSDDMIPDLEARFDPERLRMLSEWRPTVGNVFPNTMMFSFPQPIPDGRLGANISWRAFVPKGPDRFEMFNWFLVERDSSEELKDRVRLASTNNFGISGLTEVDDSDVWPLQSQSSKGALGRRQKLRYQAVGGEHRPDWWPGPGQVYGPWLKDDVQWKFWLRYLDYLTGRPW